VDPPIHENGRSAWVTVTVVGTLSDMTLAEQTALAEPAPHRFTVEEYHRMGETGLLPPDARVELIEGQVVDMSPIGRRHNSVVDRLTRLLVQRLGDTAVVRVQGSVRLSGFSEPQPDVTVLHPSDDFYATAHAGPRDVVVMIEVSDTTLRYDRNVKLPLYARSEVAEVWIVDVNARAILVASDLADGEYGQRRTAGADDILRVLGIEIAVNEVFGLPPSTS
jgi:Uma2 family endonuclease